MYITRLASDEIFSPSNKIYREVGRAKDLSAGRIYTFVKNAAISRESVFSAMGGYCT